MPGTPCCSRQYSKPSRSSSPCKQCECRVQTEQCSPPECSTEDSDAASLQLYTPVIAAVPASNKCCCCEVKPRKSLWQQLFGDRKCCSPCQKKKQETNCVCKPKKKRCLPECPKPRCCSDIKPNQPPPSKPCRPLCCCKTVKTKKVSCPKPDSIFGCHFYCNVANRENRTKQSCRCCCCCSKGDQRRSCSHTSEPQDEKISNRYSGYTCDRQEEKISNRYSSCTSEAQDEKINKRCYGHITEPQDEKILKRYLGHTSAARDEKISSRYLSHTSQPQDERLIKCYDYKDNYDCSKDNKSVTIANNSDHSKGSCRRKPLERAKPNIDKPTKSNIHIGLTFKSTETKYYANNSHPNECPPNSSINYNNHDSEGSSESSDQIITLEIRQSSGNTEQARDEEINGPETNRKNDEETSSMMSKRRNLSSVKEENESYKREVESYSQEMERKSKEDKNTSCGSLQRKRERTLNNSALAENYDLDHRVSEILRRLRTIETKINNIDINKTDFNIETETDGNKSTISFHFKDGTYDDSYDDHYRNKNNVKTTKKPDAVIEIRKTRSKSYSPNRKSSSSQVNKYRYSRSLDRGATRGQREKPKVVIKLPHGNKVSDGYVSMYSNNRVQKLDCHDSEWMEVSSELKKRKQKNTPCYCYDCVCKRIQC